MNEKPATSMNLMFSISNGGKALVPLINTENTTGEADLRENKFNFEHEHVEFQMSVKCANRDV